MLFVLQLEAVLASSAAFVQVFPGRDTVTPKHDRSANPEHSFTDLRELLACGWLFFVETEDAL